MCCFSRPVTSVTATRIFARFTAQARQAIIYQMRLDAPEDLAMILPIPVAQPAADNALAFVNLEKYADVFKDLERGFPQPPTLSIPSEARSGSIPKSKPLEVHSVGAFDASFVPNPASFTRLDERFRLPDNTWKSLPAYADYGFAVFKLKQGRADVHPMAFTFPTAIADSLFFPTVHIHDGKVHDREDFDHILYAQAGANALIPRWQESERFTSEFVDHAKTKDLIAGNCHAYRLEIRGREKNRDTLAALRRMAE